MNRTVKGTLHNKEVRREGGKMPAIATLSTWRGL